MNNGLFTRNRIAFAAGLALLAASGGALGAGFQLNETSASGLGTAFAGGAAAAEDATTLWSNPAGLSRLGSAQAAGVLHLIKPSIKFGNQRSAAALAQPLGNNGGDAGGLNVVPNLYLAMPINAQLSAGVGVNAPWGLVTEYDAGWIGRFQALKSEIKTINVNPSLAWKAGSAFSLGVGLNVQRIEAVFTNQVNYSAALLQAAAAANVPVSPAAVAGLESHARVQGSDTGWGWNVGALFDTDPGGRVGLHFRSAIRFRIAGDAAFFNPTAPAAVPAPLVAAVNAQLANTAITSTVKMPPIVNLSYVRRIDNRWDVLADAQWTGWSTIKELTFVRSNGSVLQSTPENFEDGWKLALGVRYRNADWTFRGGLAFDQSPVQTADRTARLPDADRTWLTGGVQVRLSPRLLLDVGAGYIWVKKADIDSNPTGAAAVTAATGRLAGRYDANVLLLSGQLSVAF